jgi:hypothetical protein
MVHFAAAKVMGEIEILGLSTPLNQVEQRIFVLQKD